MGETEVNNCQDHILLYPILYLPYLTTGKMQGLLPYCNTEIKTLKCSTKPDLLRCKILTVVRRLNDLHGMQGHLHIDQSLRNTCHAELQIFIIIIMCQFCSQQVGCHGSPSFSILCHSDTVQGYDIFVHSLMLSVHIVLGLPRPLLPFILPSISNRCIPSPLIICPKY